MGSLSILDIKTFNEYIPDKDECVIFDNENELCINIKTLSVYIKEYCKNNNFNNIKNDCKRENGKITQVWFGIIKVN